MNRREFLQLFPFIFLPPRSEELLGKRRPKLDKFGFRPKAGEAFRDMQADARKDGIHIYPVSTYRDFWHQLRIWNKKYRKYGDVRKVIEYTAIPGTSRHHWGTEVDLIDPRIKLRDPLSSQYFESGPFSELYLWLKKNAEKYGFYEVYDKRPERKGFKWEPWHWSFSEESVPCLKQFLYLDLKIHLKDPEILGSENFDQEFLTKYKQDYILGINPKLMP